MRSDFTMLSLTFAIDPNEEEYTRLLGADAFQRPLLYGNRLFSKVFYTRGGEYGYMQTLTGGPFEEHMERKLQLSTPLAKEFAEEEALSVTTLALSAAIQLGCNPIVFVGLDLAYLDRKRYANGVLSDKEAWSDRKQNKRTSDQLLRRKGVLGQFVDTQVKWVMESSVLSTYAKKFPDIQFFNATEGGLGIKGVKNAPIDSLQNYFTHTFDIDALLQAEIATNALSHIEKANLWQELEKIKQSLENIKTHIQKLIEELENNEHTSRDIETGRFLAYRLDIEEEYAYKPLIEQLRNCLTYKAMRLYRLPIKQEAREIVWKRHMFLWSVLLKIVCAYLEEYK